MKSVKQQLTDWEQHVKNIKSSTPIVLNEKPEERKARIDRLLNDPLAFMNYYFPSSASSEFASFHKRAVTEVENNHTKKFSFGWAIARDHAKTTFWQMFSIYIALKGWYGKDCPFLWVSKTYDQAAEMVSFIRLEFEHNNRLINDYGDLRTVGQWTDDKIVLKTGASWKALGKGQSPRGTKNKDRRPKVIIIDDIDDDEEVLNESRLDKSHDWIWGALFGAFDIKGSHLFVMLNNLIGKDSLMSRSLYGHPEKGQNLKFDYSEVINILDKKGKPSWSRYTLEECNAMIRKMGTRLANKEYFNNPVIEGKVFKQDWIRYKQLMPLHHYKYLVAYLDPSFKNKKTSDNKSLILVGLYKAEYHIIKVYCAKASVNEMIEWHYDLDAFLKRHNASAHFYMEEVFLQDLLYEDFKKVAIEKGYPIPLHGDTRKKPDKDSRISACSGDFERGNVYFNIEEKENHHMVELHEQFTLFEMGKNGIAKDGPDSYEGAKEKLKTLVFTEDKPLHGRRQKSKNTY
jgi:phage terminase large subunit-like protein